MAGIHDVMLLHGLLQERGTTHGSFDSNAKVSQWMKRFYREQPGWNNLNGRQQEALDMIALKISRILSGKPDEPDHWLDLEGYARLGRGLTSYQGDPPIPPLCAEYPE